MIFIIYALVGASIIQEIESDDPRTTSSVVTETATTITTTPSVIIKNFDRERERLLMKIIEKRQTVDLQQYTKFIIKHIREYEEELKKTYTSTPPPPTPIIIQTPLSNQESTRWAFSGSLFFIGTTLTTIGKPSFYNKQNHSSIFQVQMISYRLLKSGNYF